MPNKQPKMSSSERNHKQEVFDEIENESYQFTIKDFKKLGMEIEEPPKTKKAKIKYDAIIAALPPADLEMIKSIKKENEEDMKILQKFTGDKKVKFEKARKYLYNMYA